VGVIKNKTVLFIGLFFRVLRQIVFSRRPKAYILAAPVNLNLGDQAQLMCLEKWIRENYPELKLIRMPISVMSAHPAQVSGYLHSAICCRILLICLKLFHRQGDIAFGHSGYFFIDHHSGWFSFARVAQACPAMRMIIMPQTINFLNPWIGESAAAVFNNHPDVTILCRDQVSFEKAKKAFPKCRLLLYPDIVTTLIGTKNPVAEKRDGVLFCLRDDGEAYYKEDEINGLINQLGISRIERADTTLKIDRYEMQKNKEQLIQEFIGFVSSFKAVVTDRYHGTIFSLISQTPVIVIDSVDHKLRSGVKWYPENFGEYVCFVENLEEAREKIIEVVGRPHPSKPLPAYFKVEYYDKLKERLGNA
jgi:exopolysaccharide biosynthesis predicted pyruvyltransferase EpsI